MGTDEPLIPKHGGYRKLKSFQLGQLVYDITVRFCERYVDRRSRTCDQMVQAARSGVQNIAEGSQASGTSKKTELKLTNVARASLEELRLDYEDFLRQRGLPLLPPDHPALVRFKARRCATVEEVRLWVVDEQGRTRTGRDDQRDGGASSVLVRGGPCLVRGLFRPGGQRGSLTAEPVLLPARPPVGGPGPDFRKRRRLYGAPVPDQEPEEKALTPKSECAWAVTLCPRAAP